nr:MAG TPA: hypothetical protein [Caudoviricetes sp.]
MVKRWTSPLHQSMFVCVLYEFHFLGVKIHNGQ